MTAHAAASTTELTPSATASASGGRALLARLTRTTTDWGPTVARVALGAVMFPHGAQKTFGWFGGYGLSGTMSYFTGAMGIPAPFAAAAIAAELLGAIGLVTGTLSRVAALGIAITMAVAALMVHVHNGFFMNWNGAMAGEGFEYHLLAIGLALVVMLRGGGALSVDRLIARRLTP